MTQDLKFAFGRSVGESVLNKDSHLQDEMVESSICDVFFGSAS